MLRSIGQACGSTLAALCLVSTLALAQPQKPPHGPSQTMTCVKDDGKGRCIAAAGADGKEVVVVGEHLHKGERMTCVDLGHTITCTALMRQK
jgi:hypothetical protein